MYSLCKMYDVKCKMYSDQLLAFHFSANKANIHKHRATGELVPISV